MKTTTVRMFAACAIAGLSLSACSVRFDGGDPSPSEPSAFEVVRQREALRAQEYATLSETLGPLSAHASEQLQALGGVWEAWPEGDGPEDYTFQPEADISITDDAATIIASLQATTPELCADAAEFRDAILAATCVSRSVDLDALERGAGLPTTTSGVAASTTTSSTDLIYALDAAGAALDSEAGSAHAAGQSWWTTVVSQADGYHGLASDAVQAQGWAGTDQDPRISLYPAASSADSLTLVMNAALVALETDRDPSSTLAVAVNAAVLASHNGGTIAALPNIE